MIRYWTGIMALLMLVLSPSSLFAQDFTINRFHTDIIINGDSSFSVKETLEVEFHRPRHGIYREIPFRYTDELSKSLITPMRVLSATDGKGKKWKTNIESRENVLHIRIGDAKKYVNGIQTYVIAYEVDNAILFFDDHDELYWNVTGNFWKAPIQEASANVFLSTPGKSNTLRAACYTGPLGSRESACRFETQMNSGDFFTKRTLKAGEGLTIAFGWDKGLVTPPSLGKVFIWNIKENWSFILPIVSLVVMLNLWYRRGRDPRIRETVTVMYEPPRYDNMPLNPAEVGTIVDEKLDPRDITSTIVGLAVKGYLRIEETKREGLIFDTTDYYLSKVKQPDANLSLFETELMSRIIPGSVAGKLVSDMKNTFYTHLESLKTLLYSELVRKKYFLRNPEKVRYFYMILSFVSGAAAIALSLFLTSALLTTVPAFASFKSIVSGVLTGVIVFLFARVMPAKTRAGSSVYMDILGFQEFMKRAEKDRIERIGDKDLFSKFLPYAIALDVVDNWAKAFEGIYQDPPNWYVSPGGFRTFSPYHFTNSLDSMTSTLGSAVFSAPRGSGIGGSGSGGGGSSGGGSGGGGGGSW